MLDGGGAGSAIGVGCVNRDIERCVGSDASARHLFVSEAAKMALRSIGLRFAGIEGSLCIALVRMGLIR